MFMAAMCGNLLLHGQTLAEFQPCHPAEAEGEIVSLDFEKELPPEFELAAGYQCGWGFGENGSGGLVLRRGPGG